MKRQRFHKVYTVEGILQAINIKTALERAGIPVLTAKSHLGSYMDVLVPDTFLFDAKNILFPETRTGEIYFRPS
jgi:hypothetical protein